MKLELQKIENSTLRFRFRKAFRFAVRPVDATRDALYDKFIPDDEERAWHLLEAKAIIRAEHVGLVLRAIQSLPDPLPDAQAIEKALRRDPMFAVLSDPNPAVLMDLLAARCRAVSIPEPPGLSIRQWTPLFFRYHQYFASRYDAASSVRSFPVVIAGRPKSAVRRHFERLRDIPVPRESRAGWFDRAPFRMLFGNQFASYVGKGKNRVHFFRQEIQGFEGTYRYFVSVSAQNARRTPLDLPEAQDGAWELLDDSPAPADPNAPTNLPPPAARFRRVDEAAAMSLAARGDIFLFEIVGKDFTTRTDGIPNLNTIFFRALFHRHNLIHSCALPDGPVEFHVRKGNGRGRVRFGEDRFFVTFNITFNPSASTHYPPSFNHVQDLLVGRTNIRIIQVARTPTGYTLQPYVGKEDASTPTDVARIKAFREDTAWSRAYSDKEAAAGRLVGDLTRLVVAHSAFVCLDPKTPRTVSLALRNKFSYVVLKERRNPASRGGALLGYQFPDRLFLGDAGQALAAWRHQTP